MVISQSHRIGPSVRTAARVPNEAVTAVVSLDGVMVPMKDGAEPRSASARALRAGFNRRAKGRAGYQEAGCATLSFYDIKGERLETVSLARMPEPKKATLKTMLSAELDTVLGRRPDLEVVTVADGPHDNWRYLDTLAPDATAAADFDHAVEQLKSALDARCGQNVSGCVKPAAPRGLPGLREPRCTTGNCLCRAPSKGSRR